jgi:hypothetical protein
MAGMRLKRSDWGKIAKTVRKNICQCFREVSIDSIFFRGTLKTQAQDISRIDFLGQIFPQDLPGTTLSGMITLPSRAKTFFLFRNGKSTSIRMPCINRSRVFARFTIQ